MSSVKKIDKALGAHYKKYGHEEFFYPNGDTDTGKFEAFCDVEFRLHLHNINE